MASRGMGATLSPRPSRRAGQYKPLRRVTQSRSKGFFQTAAGEIEGLGLAAALDRIGTGITSLARTWQEHGKNMAWA